MSNYNTKVWLEEAQEHAAAGRTIAEDRPCSTCGYNLRGLRLGGVCPECGEAIAVGRRTLKQRKTLADAPIAYIRVLQAGYLAMGVGGLLVGAMGVLEGLGRGQAAAWTGLLAASLWVGGLAIVAAPRPEQAREGAEDALWWALRIAALATQSAWVALALWGVAASAGGAVSMPGAAAQGLALTGIVGFTPAFWLIKRMAAWADDPRYGDRALNAGLYLSALLTAWMLGLRLMAPVPMPSLRLMVGGVSLVALLTLAAYGYALLQVLREAQSASWTIAKIREDRAKANREDEKRKREWEEGQRMREREGFGGPLAPPPGSMMGLGRAQRASGHGGQDLPARRRG